MELATAPISSPAIRRPEPARDTWGICLMVLVFLMLGDSEVDIRQQMKSFVPPYLAMFGLGVIWYVASCRWSRRYLLWHYLLARVILIAACAIPYIGAALVSEKLAHPAADIMLVSAMGALGGLVIGSVMVAGAIAVEFKVPRVAAAAKY